jgi:DNA-binding phage protein
MPEETEHPRWGIIQDAPKAKVVRDLGVSRQTLYAAISGAGKYVVT